MLSVSGKRRAWRAGRAGGVGSRGRSKVVGGACAPVEALWAGPDPGAGQGRGLGGGRGPSGPA